MELRNYLIKRWKITLISLTSFLFLSIFLSSMLGAARIDPSTTFLIILKKIPFLSAFFNNYSIDEAQEIIISEVRLPRVIASALVGMALASAGVVYQGIFRNPMADPYVIGSSSGASLGASLAIFLLYNFFGVLSIPFFAFLGSFLAVMLVYRIARVGFRVPVTTLLLAGIALSIFLSALVSLILTLAKEELRAIIFWLLGGFGTVDWKSVLSILPFTFLGFTFILYYARELNLIITGEESAEHLGVNVELVKKRLIITSSLLTASAVSISGLIGFVGLIIPHIMRILIGPDHRILIPSSALGGAIFLILADSIARIILLPAELPVGIITALAGGPFFIYLLKRKKGEYNL
ncbi:Hemin transport system permease protein HmuU [archaeon HR06]|nr:Hemin transport system permease protein HmuU [archaeon HR06]